MKKIALFLKRNTPFRGALQNDSPFKKGTHTRGTLSMGYSFLYIWYSEWIGTTEV